jgi:ubiquinone/menaquinone biosynthesis C-methylase UbiE
VQPDYASHDRAVWERIFSTMPPAWYDATSDAMNQCRAYFAAHPCARLLDLGSGFGRWAHFIVGHGVGEVVGVDYAEQGIRAASAWALRAGFNARFIVASVTALPFGPRRFDAVLAAVVLDNLSRTDRAHAVQEFNAAMQPGAHGFFVFNPVLTPAELATIGDDNPTKSCMHVVYEDGELGACLPGWSIERLGTTAERFRVIEATFQG